MRDFCCCKHSIPSGRDVAQRGEKRERVGRWQVDDAHMRKKTLCASFTHIRAQGSRPGRLETPHVIVRRDVGTDTAPERPPPDEGNSPLGRQRTAQDRSRASPGSLRALRNVTIEELVSASRQKERCDERRNQLRPRLADPRGGRQSRTRSHTGNSRSANLSTGRSTGARNLGTRQHVCPFVPPAVSGRQL
ncbi:hypothetical protein EXIGLDRAFT_251643 [Exidia glandulosa HHB12029]|uniref:Uncharacterized protein n=1 Tax=Exidia glandulosa HHB12029 TaxID=1314781 RepID=A0A165MI61_EXIGL|nr:hypothetical protein EXIGLDRAFT_251643 [Exidia glandulosa HHB12029]